MRIILLTVFAACAALEASAANVLTSKTETPWTVTYSSSSGQVQVRDIALDSSENVYIGGITYGNLFSHDSGGASFGEAFVAKLSPLNGSLIWGVQPQSLRETSVQFISWNGKAIFTVGTTQNPINGSSYTGLSDIVVSSRAASTGVEKWRIRIGTLFDEGVNGLITDSTGLYITGFTAGSLYTPNAGGWDAILLKVGFGGLIQWTQQFGRTGYDYGVSLQFGSANEVLVFGYSDSLFGTTTGVFTASYDRESGAFIRGGQAEYDTIDTNNYPIDVMGASARYSASGVVKVKVVKNTCLKGTHLEKEKSTTGPNVLSCLPCDEASYSEDYADKCYSCPAGTSSAKGSAHCFDCEAGLYSNSGELCTPCPQLKWSLSGAESCDFYTWRTTAGVAVYKYVGYIFAGLYFVFAVLLLSLELPIDACCVLLLSAVNVLSDQAYVVKSIYDNDALMSMCLVFVMLPGFHFAYYILRACNPTKQFKLRYLVKQPMLQAPLWKISVGKDSLPQWAGSERAANTTPSSSTAIDNANPGDDIAGAAAGSGTSQTAISEAVFDAQIAREASSPLPSPEMGTLVVAWATALLRQLLYSVGWAVFHAVYFTPWYMLHGLFYTFFWILGFYLYQSKVLYVKKVEVWWMAWVFGQGPVSEIWPATCAADSSVCLQDINAALLAEVLLESFPEFALQFANNISMQSWPVIAMVSTISSGLSIVLFLVRVTYWHVWMRLSISQMPLWNALESHMMMWLSDEEEGDIITAKDSSGALLLSDGQANDSAAFEMTSKLNAQKEMNLQLLKEKEEMKQKLSFLERVMASRRHNGTNGGGGYSAALGHDDEDDDQTATNFAAAVVTDCAAESGELEEEDADLDELLL